MFQSTTESESTHMPRRPSTPKEPIADIAKRLRTAMKRADVGRTLVAIEVARLAEHWETKHKDEAGGLELGPWLIKWVHPTVKLATYMELALFAHRVGLGVAERVEHRALRWMGRQIPDEKALRAACDDVQKAFREQGKMPLTLSQVHRVCARYSVPAKGREGLRDQVRALKDRVRRLEEQVRRLGEEPVE